MPPSVAQTLYDPAALAPDPTPDPTLDPAPVDALTETPAIRAFWDFAESLRGGRRYAAFQLDALMRIPRLVPNVFVVDFQRGVDDGLWIRFSGTAVDLEYNRNMAGRRLEDAYPGDDAERLMAGYRRVYTDGLCWYSRRMVQVRDGAWQSPRAAESLMVPCSKNGRDIDCGLGIAVFAFADAPVAPTSVHW
jgi:hypothetical protein